MLKQVSDQLAYFDFPSKVILYQNGSQALLIDAGLEARTARQVIKKLEADQVVPEYLLLTHAHADHFGGAAELKKRYPKLVVLGSVADKPIFEHPEYEPNYLYGAEPLTALKNKFLLGNAIQLDQLVEPDQSLHLFGDEWQSIDLSGHTPGQIGFITPEGVVLTADAIFPEEVVEKYRLLYHFDVGKALKSLQRLEKLSLEGTYASFVPGHGEPLESLQNVLVTNLQSIHATLELVQQKLLTPTSREELVAYLIQEYQINQTVPQYYLTLSTVSAYLSYLEQSGLIQGQVTDGRLLFQQKDV